MNQYIAIVATLASAGAVYYTVEWLTSSARRRNLTYLERTAIDVADEEREKEGSGPIRRLLDEYGWYGDPSLPLAATVAAYLVIAVAARSAGLPPVPAAAVAVPAAVVAVRQTLRILRVRRQRQFNQQLVQALELLAGQLEAGNGVQRALEIMTPGLPDPLRGELEQALEATVASKDLIEAIRDIGVRYPSKALRMFIAALDIERMTAGQLGRPIREAADMLRKEFELTGELKAETAQQKLAAIIMVLGISAISLALIAGLDSSAFLTPVGVIALSLGAANFSFGIWRVARMLSAVEQEA